MLRESHQPWIALLVLCSLLGMGTYFWHRAAMMDGLIDIDQAQKIDYQLQVDINSADWPQLVVLPGLGETLAKAIVQYRQQSGPFRSLDSIQQVPGIGKKKLEQLRPFLKPIEFQSVD